MKNEKVKKHGLEKKESSAENDNDKFSDGSEKDKTEIQKNNDEKPEIYQVKDLSKTDKQSRKGFIRTLGGIIAITPLVGSLQSCETSDFGIETNSGTCTCHVVCNCDSVSNDDKTTKRSEWTETYSGNTCTCDSVCTCNTICTCNSVSICTCDSEGSNSGYHYWHPN